MNKLSHKWRTQSKKESKSDNTTLQSRQVERIRMSHLIAGLQPLDKGSEAGLWFLGDHLDQRFAPCPGSFIEK